MSAKFLIGIIFYKAFDCVNLIFKLVVVLRTLGLILYLLFINDVARLDISAKICFFADGTSYDCTL